MPVFPMTDIYGITDARLSLGRSTLEVVSQMLEAGVKVIQYREKDLPSGAMLKECLALRKLTSEAGASFIVNDHVDIALLCKADGVHIGQDDLPLQAVRSIVPAEMFIGVSVRTMEEAEGAIQGGADYLGAGAVFPTSTKGDALETGLAFVHDLAGFSPVPVVAIGGINETNIRKVKAQGISCFAIISAITMATDIRQKIRQLRAILQE